MIKRLFLLLIFTSLLFAQDKKDFPALSTADFIDVEIVREEFYDGESLWGFIDGGADVYLEYGFDKLLFQEIKWKGETYRVEYYKMIDEETAFGIFSISTHKCTGTSTITKWICSSPFQIMAAIGKFYITIANEKGTKEAESQSTLLLSKIIEKHKGPLFEFSSSITNKLIAGNTAKIKFIKGNLGFQNGFPSWQEMFSEFKNYKVYLFQLDDAKTYSYVAKIIFPSSEEAKKFIVSLGFKISGKKMYYSKKNGKVLKEVKMISENEFYFCETNKGKSVIDKY